MELNNLRQAEPSDIVVGQQVWVDGDDGFAKREIREVLKPTDPYKAYCANDGCRYGLESTYIELISEDPAIETPWLTCKVGFNYEGDSDDVWRLLEKTDSEFSLPYGWSFVGSDDAGARCVIIFEVDDAVPTVEAGEIVKKILRTIYERSEN